MFDQKKLMRFNYALVAGLALNLPITLSNAQAYDQGCIINTFGTEKVKECHWASTNNSEAYSLGHVSDIRSCGPKYWSAAQINAYGMHVAQLVSPVSSTASINMETATGNGFYITDNKATPDSGPGWCVEGLSYNWNINL